MFAALHLLCPGFNKQFADRTTLRHHRCAWKTADPACRNAAHTERPRTVRRHGERATSGIPTPWIKKYILVYKLAIGPYTMPYDMSTCYRTSHMILVYDFPEIIY